jgi:hypothetical protein
MSRNTTNATSSTVAAHNNIPHIRQIMNDSSKTKIKNPSQHQKLNSTQNYMHLFNGVTEAYSPKLSLL